MDARRAILQPQNPRDFTPMSRRSYRFGDYRIDPALRELRRGHELIALPPHVFDFLA